MKVEELSEREITIVFAVMMTFVVVLISIAATLIRFIIKRERQRDGR